MSAELLIEGGIALAGTIFGAGGMAMVLRFTRRDVNGLGRKFWAGVACDLRCIAEEVPDEVIRAKLMHLADLIDPR